MFKESPNSLPNDNHFGVGSMIKAGNRESWLVISYQGNSIGLIDLVTHTIVKAPALDVADKHHLTKAEARQLVSLIGNQYTFSDYDMIPKRLKV